MGEAKEGGASGRRGWGWGRDWEPREEEEIREEVTGRVGGDSRGGREKEEWG